jgi:hypothetical protein
VHTSTWGGPEALARLEAHNAEVRRVRARIEKVFGTVKRCYGLGLSEISCGSGMNGTKEPNHAQTQTASYS